MKPFDQWAEDLADHLRKRGEIKVWPQYALEFEKLTVWAPPRVTRAEYIFEQTYDVEFCHDDHLMTIDPNIMESLKMMLEKQIAQAILTAPSSSPEGVMSDAKVIA